MTQLKCPECGKTFNDTEQACPNCGCPVNLIPIQNDENRKNNQQNRMIALAIPIGILSLAIAFMDLFRAFLFWTNINTSRSQFIIMESVDYIVEIIAFTLMMVWFLSLYQGSVKNSKLKTISIVALMGICCFFIVFGHI